MCYSFLAACDVLFQCIGRIWRLFPTGFSQTGTKNAYTFVAFYLMGEKCSPPVRTGFRNEASCRLHLATAALQLRVISQDSREVFVRGISSSTACATVGRTAKTHAMGNRLFHRANLLWLISSPQTHHAIYYSVY